jgi:O-methyltransferase
MNAERKFVIFGAGQAGRVARRLLPPGCEAAAYADNNDKKWGSTYDGLPVINPNEIINIDPDEVRIAILNREAVLDIRVQLASGIGYNGHVSDLSAYRDEYDARLATLRLLAEELNAAGVLGCAAELGVYKGEFAAEINRLFPERPLHLFDTFAGFDERDVKEEDSRFQSHSRMDFSDTSVEAVKSRLPHKERAVFHQGYFPATAPQEDFSFAFVSLDPDLYLPTYNGLAYFYPRLAKGGAIMVHDCFSTQFPGVGEAARKYCREQGLFLTPVCDLHGSAILRKA